jgi:Flp pilus assembly pilin Flp
VTVLALLAAVASAGTAVRPGIASDRAGQRGQGIVEYGLILGLGTLLAIVILVVFGDQVADIVQWIGRTVTETTGGR